MKLKLFILFISFFLFQNSYGQHTDVINSNRPGESMSGFAVGKTVIQIESGVSYVKEKHNLLDRKLSPKSVREVLTTMSFAERRDAAIRKI